MVAVTEDASLMLALSTANDQCQIFERTRIRPQILLHHIPAGPFGLGFNAPVPEIIIISELTGNET